MQKSPVWRCADFGTQVVCLCSRDVKSKVEVDAGTWRAYAIWSRKEQEIRLFKTLQQFKIRDKVWVFAYWAVRLLLGSDGAKVRRRLNKVVPAKRGRGVQLWIKSDINQLVIYPEDTVRYVLLHWYILLPLLFVIREDEEASGFMGSLDLRLLQAAVFPMTSQYRAWNI